MMKYAVIVSKGRFADINTAAHAENEIDWWNENECCDQTVCTTAWAALELERFLRGDTTVLSDCDTVPHAETVIFLGNGEENRGVKRLEEKLGVKLGCKDGVQKNGYRMLGFCFENKNIVVLSGTDRVGTLYAAYSYLERMGVHFTEPGEPQFTAPNGECSFDITEEPSFVSRGAMSAFIYGDMQFLEWVSRNKFNSVTFKCDGQRYHTQKKLGIDSVEGGHKISYMFLQPHEEYPYCHAIYGGEGKPEDPYPVSELCRAPSGAGGIFTYGDAHPEWYALVDGVRRMRRFPERFKEKGGASGDNLCTGNEDAMHELCTQLVDALAEGEWKYADYLNLWPIDNGTWCECEACKKIGNFSRRILMLAYKLDKYIKAARKEKRINRDIFLICPAYHETLEVPDFDLPEDFDYKTCSVVFYPIERCYLHDIDDPICQEANATLYSELLPWTERKTYKGELVIGEYYNVSTFAAMPFVLTTRIKNEIPLYHALGTRHFHYMHMTARDWGFIAINNYLHARLIWNKDADANEIINRYFSARYGDEAGKMQALYEKIEKAVANCKLYKHYQYCGDKRVNLFAHIIQNNQVTEESLFPTKHMKLDSRTDDPQAGPSLKEALEGLTEAKAELEEILLSCKNEAVHSLMEKDMRRLDFGVRITRFLYLICHVAVGRNEYLAELRALAKNLEADKESMQGYDFGPTFENALTATWMASTYYKRFAVDADESRAEDGVAL